MLHLQEVQHHQSQGIVCQLSTSCYSLSFSPGSHYEHQLRNPGIKGNVAAKELWVSYTKPVEKSLVLSVTWLDDAVTFVLIILIYKGCTKIGLLLFVTVTDFFSTGEEVINQVKTERKSKSIFYDMEKFGVWTENQFLMVNTWLMLENPVVHSSLYVITKYACTRVAILWRNSITTYYRVFPDP